MAVILVVDDDPITRVMYRTRLVELGHVVYEEVDGRRGVTKAEELKPSLIIMGVMMPVMNGLDALKLLKSNATTKDIPVVLMTGANLDTNKHSDILKLAYKVVSKHDVRIDETVQSFIDVLKAKR